MKGITTATLALLCALVASLAIAAPASAGPRDWCASDCANLCKKNAGSPADANRCISWHACAMRQASPCRNDPPKATPGKGKVVK